MSETMRKHAKNSLVVSGALAVLASGLVTAAPAQAKTGDVTNPLVAETYRYSSEYGGRCIPVLWGSTSHLGQDLALKDGSPIRSIADGTVVNVTNPKGVSSGYLAVQHKIDGQNVYSGYYHMWQASKLVKVGQKVKKGQTIAYVGSSGPSTAPHLHFEIWKNGFYGKGYTVNPVDFMKSQGVDIKKDAYLVYNLSKPSNCTYYANTKNTLYANASYAKPIGTFYQNQALVSTPGSGSQSGNFVKVTVGGKTGWAYRGVVSPYKVKQTQPIGDRDLPSTDSEKVTNTTKNVTYKTTGNLNMRSGANTTYSVVKVLAKNTSVVTTGKKSGSWLQVKAGSSTGWVSSSYLSKVVVSTPKPSPKPKPVAPKVVTKTYTVTANLHLRAGAGTNNKSLTVLKQNSKVTSTGKTSGRWYQVKAGSKTGWVSSTYLKEVKSSGSSKPTAPTPPKQQQSNSKTYTTTGNLNMRAGAGTGHKVVSVLSKGQKVTATGKTSGRWYQVKAGSKTGWVSSTYLKKVSETGKSPVVKKSVTKKTTANLNMRAGAGTGHKIVVTLKKGTTVTVLKTSGGWSQVKSGSKTGWVSNSYIK